MLALVITSLTILVVNMIDKYHNHSQKIDIHEYLRKPDVLLSKNDKLHLV